MSLTKSSFDVRAEHPERVHVDRQMEKIRVKETARDQLPHLESDRGVELWHKKMPNRPESEVRQQTRAGYRLKCENGDVDAY